MVNADEPPKAKTGPEAWLYESPDMAQFNLSAKETSWTVSLDNMTDLVVMFGGKTIVLTAGEIFAALSGPDVKKEPTP